MDELKEAIKGSDIEVIKAKLEAATKPLHEFSTAIYQQPGQDAGGCGAGTCGHDHDQGQGQGDPQQDNVVDADYEVKDEGDKK